MLYLNKYPSAAFGGPEEGVDVSKYHDIMLKTHPYVQVILTRGKSTFFKSQQIWTGKEPPFKQGREMPDA